MKKIICLLILAVLLTGCGETYEDTNGDDNYDLQTLKLEDVFGSYSSSGTSTSKDKFLKNGDVITYKGFNGITNLYEFETFTIGSSNCTIKISFTITKGNGALVLRNDEEIVHVFDVNKDDQECYVEVDEYFMYLTVYGESCNFTVDYEITY